MAKRIDAYIDGEGYGWVRQHENVWLRSDGAQAYWDELRRSVLIRPALHRNPSNEWHELRMYHDDYRDVLNKATWVFDRWSQVIHATFRA